MSDAKQLTLAIESAIAGGSLSLLDATGSEIANWVGRDTEVARAEDILVNIDNMLSSVSVSKQDLSLVAVSAGPGSFTGIRIGIATALGLRNGLDIEMSSVSALEAMANSCRSSHEVTTSTVAVPVGRNAICIQAFENISPAGDPQSVPESEFGGMIETGLTFIVHRLLFEKYGTLPTVIDSGANIAYAVGRASSPGVVRQPLFISKSF